MREILFRGQTRRYGEKVDMAGKNCRVIGFMAEFFHRMIAEILRLFTNRNLKLRSFLYMPILLDSILV